jgi:hypothetical protein
MYSLFRKHLVIAICLALALACTAQAQHNITILRGVDANVNTGYASMPPGQFAFTGNPETLSLFDTTANAHAANVTKPCYVHIVVNMPNDPPVQGNQGTITVNGHAYAVTFDNNPVGHWSIFLGGQQQATARADFSAHARANPNFTDGFGLGQGVNCHYPQ